MGEIQQETFNLIIKILIYAVGVLIGLAYNLAEKYEKGHLGKKLIVLEVSATLAAAYLVWWILAFSENKYLLAGFSVLVGNKGRKLFQVAWESALKIFTNKVNTD